MQDRQNRFHQVQVVLQNHGIPALPIRETTLGQRRAEAGFALIYGLLTLIAMAALSYIQPRLIVPAVLSIYIVTLNNTRRNRKARRLGLPRW